MIYIDSFKLPTQGEINSYFGSTNVSPYPWNIFFDNGLEWVSCKDITMFYGNNGSGKSTLLNLLADKVCAQRNNELFKDIIYNEQGAKLNPFDDFVDSIVTKLAIDEEGNLITLPAVKKLITGEDIFKKIDERSKHNQKAVTEADRARIKQKEIIEKGYSFNGMDDYDDLVKLLEARKLSKKKYAEAHALSKEQMKSNGETALEFYAQAFQSGGIYFLDEPENCLSPIFQIELIKLLQDSIKYFECQFFICTHSPLLLSLSNSIIYNLDMSPVITQKWSELENVKIYYDFFMAKKDLF